MKILLYSILGYIQFIDTCESKEKWAPTTHTEDKIEPKQIPETMFQNIPETMFKNYLLK